MTQHTLQRESSFHIAMAVLTVGSLWLNQLMEGLDLVWNPPSVGLITLALAGVWLPRWFLWRQELDDERIRVLEDRTTRLQARLEAMEDA